MDNLTIYLTYLLCVFVVCICCVYLLCEIDEATRFVGKFGLSCRELLPQLGKWARLPTKSRIVEDLPNVLNVRA